MFLESFTKNIFTRRENISMIFETILQEQVYELRKFLGCVNKFQDFVKSLRIL